jgi:hypothetical protein
MFQFVGKYLQVPTFRNTTVQATTLASQITGELNVRSPQARTDRAVC